MLNVAEIITIALYGELADVDSENVLYSFVKRNYRYFFQKMCDRSQFNRTCCNLLQVTNLIFMELARHFADNVFIVDSFPLDVCKFFWGGSFLQVISLRRRSQSF